MNEKCAVLCLVAALSAFTAVRAEQPAPSTEGVVFGTVDVQYQATTGLMGKMTESTRSRKWLFLIASAADGGAAYRVQERFEVKEGHPRTFQLALPEGAYRVVAAENALSGGMEKLSVPIDAHFSVVPGQNTYIGRLVLYVQNKMLVALAAKEVIDCRDVDLGLLQASYPDIDAGTVAATQLLSIPPKDGDPAPPPTASCEPPKTQ